ncbi:NUDIX hydrolase [Rhizobium tibeticum]|uniref:NUDIX hydrolase n=1 Tax=Rhizobium tibeticum TaxID=501024 RepID=UPI0027962EB4|nr:NUDIX domain-containing protein [Rhizobium tibeticum]
MRILPSVSASTPSSPRQRPDHVGQGAGQQRRDHRDLEPEDRNLVGSRRNGRWGVPKGHLDPGETTAAAALREAFEEAGVEGLVTPDVFGSFSYRKDSTPHQYQVSVHLLEVSLNTRVFESTPRMAVMGYRIALSRDDRAIRFLDGNQLFSFKTRYLGSVLDIWL